MSTTSVTDTELQARASRLWHAALFYDNADEYLDGVLPFLRDGLAAGEPALVAVPQANIDLIRSAMGSSSAGQVDFADMTQLGRNPCRIIPAIRRFADTHAGRQVRFVGEPIWAGRTAPECAEATRHEALINLAFSDGTVSVLCPYDVRGLDSAVLADGRRTHPDVIDRGTARPSASYTEPREVCRAAAWPLSAPPADAAGLEFGADELATVRRFVHRQATAAGLPDARADEVVMAVNEVTTNTLVHGAGTGQLLTWREPGSIVCEVREEGDIPDPLVGRRLPAPGADGGRGLFLANQLCDLVELRSDANRVAIRLHAGL